MISCPSKLTVASVCVSSPEDGRIKYLLTGSNNSAFAKRYNDENYRSGIGLHNPISLHCSQSEGFKPRETGRSTVPGEKLAERCSRYPKTFNFNYESRVILDLFVYEGDVPKVVLILERYAEGTDENAKRRDEARQDQIVAVDEWLISVRPMRDQSRIKQREP